MKAALLLCSMLITSLSYNMSNNHLEYDFAINEVLVPFNPDRDPTVINYAELLKTGLDALTKDPLNSLSIPEHISKDHIATITSHLLLKASTCKNEFTEQWVSLLLAYAANPLHNQKIITVIYAQKADIGLLVSGGLVYNEPTFATQPCPTALFLALRHRNVPAVQAMLRHNPNFALALYNERGNTYADYVDWLCNNANTGKAELEEIQILFRNAQQQLQQPSTSS